MPLTPPERSVIARAFQDAMTSIEEMIHTYCEKTGVPERLGLGVFDATGAGPDHAAEGDIQSRMIAERTIKVADWGERNYSDTARTKVRTTLRTNRDTGDLVRNAPELFEEGDMRSPGGVLAEVDGKRISVGSSGMRGTEDEAFALILIEMMKRLTSPPS